MTAEASNVQTVVERRRSARAPVTVRVEYSTVDALFTEFSRNINEGGLFIETDQPLGLDERVRLSFRLPGAEAPIQVAGRVAWIAPPEADVPGMGIEFDELDREARRQIDELIRGLKVGS